MTALSSGRRRVLRIGATLVALGTGGCLEAAPWRDDDTGTGENWPQFQRDAANTGRTVEGAPAGEPAVLWQVDVEGEFVAGPVVWEGRVFAGSTGGTLLAVAADTGSVRWRVEVGDDLEATPAVVDGTAYVASTVDGDGAVIAVDALTGNERWRFELGAERFSHPTVADETVHLGATDGDRTAIYALDARTGEERWVVEADDALADAPAVSDGVLYAGTAAGTVLALDAATGNTVWRYGTTRGRAIAGGPSIADGRVFVGSLGTRESGRNFEAYLYALEAASGEVAWRFQSQHPFPGCPAVDDETVYVFAEDGNVYAVAAVSGEERWSTNAVEEDAGAVSPAVADEAVLFGGGDPVLMALDGGGEWLWRTQLDGPVVGPALSDGVVYAGTRGGTLYALE